MADQLAMLGETPSPKTKACRCGHFSEHHVKNGKGGCTYGASTFHGGCLCKRFRARGRLVVVPPPELSAPVGSIVLKRPDTKRPKAMGWALIGVTNVVVYLDQLRTVSPNVSRHVYGSALLPSMQRRMMASMANATKARVERAMSAIEQCKVIGSFSSLPVKIVVTRISSGRLDGHDNLPGALKPIVDGICEALLIDDKHLSLEGVEKKKIAVLYRQATPGKRGVRGVRIELFWQGGWP